MIDEMTKDRLRVSHDAVAGPYMMVLLDQLEDICKVLDDHKIHYWVDSYAIRFGNEPATTVINFGRNGDPGRIQAALDVIE